MLAGNRRGPWWLAVWRGLRRTWRGRTLPCRVDPAARSRAPIWSTSPASIPRPQGSISAMPPPTTSWAACFTRSQRAGDQRPAAEALSRVQTRAEAAGYGLLIFDPYRPWLITRDDGGRNPARQTRIRRRSGQRIAPIIAAVRSTPQPAPPMAWRSPCPAPTTISPRRPIAATPDAACGGARGEPDAGRLDGWPKASCRLPMNGGHFDWADWRRYPIMDVPLEDVTAGWRGWGRWQNKVRFHQRRRQLQTFCKRTPMRE